MSGIERQFRGVWIPAELWMNTDLSLQEKVMLVEVDSLQHPEKGCFKSNKKLGEFFHLSESRVSRIMSSLEKKGWIRVEVIRKGKEIVERRAFMLRRLDGSLLGVAETQGGCCGNASNPIAETQEGYCGNDIERGSGVRGSIEGANPPNPPLPGGDPVRQDESETTAPPPDPDVTLPEWLPEQAWQDFVEHRRQAKAKMTAKAKTMLLNKLERLRGKGHDPVELLETSIVNGWKGVFEPKGAPPRPQRARYHGLDEWSGEGLNTDGQGRKTL